MGEENQVDGVVRIHRSPKSMSVTHGDLTKRPPTTGWAQLRAISSMGSRIDLHRSWAGPDHSQGLRLAQMLKPMSVGGTMGRAGILENNINEILHAYLNYT